jgi:beta-glucosidase
MWDFYPEGLYELLERINQVYAPKELMVLENGTSLPDKEDDKMRIEYLKAHIEQVAKALQNNIPVKGYFVWSLLDNFEWSLGYTKRFGLLYVDFKTLERHPKKSAHWYAAFLRARGQH